MLDISLFTICLSLLQTLFGGENIEHPPPSVLLAQDHFPEKQIFIDVRYR
jgi:hypothetical protein